MTVTDEAKLFAIRKQLLEMRYNLDASINIINYVFERSNDPGLVVDRINVSGAPALSDPIGDELYPGQIPNTELVCEEEEGIECVE